MKFWKFIKDELNNLEEQDNNSSQETNDSEETESKEEQNDNHEQENNSNKIEEESNNSSQEVSEEQTNESTQESNSNEVEESNNTNQEASEEQTSESKQENNSNNTEEESNNSNQEVSEEQPSESKQENNSNNTEEESEASEEMSNEQPSESNNESQESSSTEEESETSEEMSNEQSSESNNESQESSSTESEESETSEEMNNNTTSQTESKNNEESSQESEDKKQELEDKVEKLIEKVDHNTSLTEEQKKALYEKLKKSIEEIRKRKAEKLKKEHLNPENNEVEQSEETKYELSEQTNKFLNQLGELPSFENRERGGGYSIDTSSNTEVPESIIRTLITKFLNQRFCRHVTDLNVRSNSLVKSDGFYRWETKDVVIHLKTKQLNKVLTDKYGYDYDEGKHEDIPLSFYFDMSGSMSGYTNMLAVIAIELLKKKVKVLIGYNERVNVQIDSIEKNITVEELSNILESAGYYGSDTSNYKKDSRVKHKFIDRNIDNYLVENKAEKCVVFSDFDPLDEVTNLSHAADVYWFCFESNFSRRDITNFNGFIYKVQNLMDLERGLVKVNKKRFELLCYADNPKNLQKKVRGNR